MAEKTRCPICGAEASEDPPTGDSRRIHCPRCGRYVISRTAEATLLGAPLSPVEVSSIAGWLHGQPEPTVVDVARLGELRRRPTPTAQEKARALFQEIARGTTHGQWIELNVNDQRLWGAASAGSAEEIIFLLKNYLVGRLKWLEDLDTWALGGFARFIITPEGWDVLEETRRT